MYIVPQTVVKLYRDIPWNKDYKHTYWFATKTAQDTYFASKLKYSFTDFTYVRQTGVIRVPKKADDLFDCNYISFLNAGYGTKIFYAFITKIEYVNDETSYISFELDYIQTWKFELVVKQCFVEREHVADDTFGIHTVPENLPIGSYVANSTDTVTYTYGRDSAWKLIILAIPDASTTSDRGYMWGHVYTGADVYVVRGSDYNVTYITSVISSLINANAQIVAMYCIPDEWDDDVPKYLLGPSRGDTIYGYTPKNNKLFCYPYNFCKVTSSDGDKVELLYEDDFDSAFRIRFTELNGGQAVLYPTNYKNEMNNFNEYGVSLTNPAQCTWSEDSYLQNMASGGILNTIKGIPTSVASSTSIGGGIGLLFGLVKGAYDVASDMVISDVKPDKVHVGQPKSLMVINNNEFGFRIERMSVKAEYAKLIDDYFTRFGYKVMVNKVPELTSRRYFNYVKTVSATIEGNISQEAETKLCEIFDNGITLWHTSDIGNYNVDNSIVS